MCTFFVDCVERAFVVSCFEYDILKSCMNGREVEGGSHLPKLCFLCSLSSFHTEVGLKGCF